MTIEEKANSLFEKNYYGIVDLDKDVIIKTMLEFAIEMCELQKQECANSVRLSELGDDDYDYPTIHIKSTLNCKNVCEN